MHILSNNESFFPVLIELTQSKDLLCLELVEILVYSGTLNRFVLTEVSLLEVVILNNFFWMPVGVNKIVNAMAEWAVVFVKDTKSSEIETTNRSLLLDLLGLVLDKLDDLVLDLLLVELHCQIVVNFLLKL